MSANSASSQLTALKLSVATLIFFSLALPSGSLYGIPFKHMAYIACVISIFESWSRKGGKIDRHLIILFTLVCAFTVFYALVGAFQATTPFGYVLLEGTGVFTALTLVLLLLASRSIGGVSNQEMVRYAFFGIFAFATWKVLVVLLLVFKIVQYPQVYTFLTENAGYRPVASGIFGGLVRFNLIIYDFIVTYFLFLIPAYPKLFEKIPIFVRTLFMIVGIACLIFAFSRLLFGMTLLLWAYTFIMKASFKWKLIIVGLALSASTLALPWFEGAYEQRFRAIDSSKSDDIRLEQITALIDAWSTSPFIGGGFGYYSKELIRDPSVPFSYEVQWVGFLAKLGIMGIAFLTILIGLLYFGLLSGERTLDHYVLAFVLSCFILGGFTNQYLVSSASGIFYALTLFAGSILRKQFPVNPRADKKEKTKNNHVGIHA